MRNKTDVPFRDWSPYLRGESTALTSRGEHDDTHIQIHSCRGFSRVTECVTPALAVMRLQIFHRAHQLWLTLFQPLLYTHFIAACEILPCGVNLEVVCYDEQ